MTEEKAWSKKLKRPAAALVLILIVILAYSFYFKKEPVDFYRLKPVDIKQTVLAGGRVSYPQPYDITAVSPGKITEVNCSEGELVEENHLLVLFDDFQENQDLQIALSNLRLMQIKQRSISEELLPKQEEQVLQGKIRLEEAEKELARQKVLFDQGAISAADYEKAQSRYHLALSEYKEQLLARNSYLNGGSASEAAAQITFYEAQLKLAQKAVEDKKIYSPFSGTVSKVHYSAGQQVTAGAVLLTLLKGEDWVVEAEVDEKELSLLKEGQPALVALDAYPQEKMEASLVYIAPQIDVQKGTCLVRLEIKEPNPHIKYGMSASVEMLSHNHKQVLALPKQFLDIDGNSAYVWAWKDKQAEKTPVLYSSLGERWVIVQGLPEGTAVLFPEKASKGTGIRPGREVLPDAL